jgi:O-antigen ligase
LAATGLLFLAPFVVPVHRAPQAAFDMEWLAGLLLAGLAIALGLQRARSVELNWPLPAWLTAMVAVTAAQFALGQLVYSTQLLFACVYGFAIFGAYWIGRRLGGADLRHRAVRAMAWALITGAVVSLVVQWLQLLDAKGLPWWLFFDIVDPWYRTRPFGNLGQANLMSTYLVWSMIAALFLFRDKRHVWPPTVLLFLIAIGVALTRSRMGLLFSLIVAAAIWLPWALRPTELRSRIGMTLGLVLGYATGVLVVSLAVAYQGAAVDTAVQRFAEEGGLAVRLVMWLDALRVAATSPWIGVGFGQYALAQYWAATAAPHVQTTNYVHNIILQTAAELGWPMAIALGLIGAWWACAQFKRRIGSPESGFAWAVLLVVGVHSLLEWPLASLHFAIPTAILFALGEPELCAPFKARMVTTSRTLALIGASGVLLALPMMLEFNELADVTERAELERRTNQGLSESTLMRMLALGDASRLRVYSESLLVFLRLPDAVEPTAEEIRRHERLLILGADPRLITRIVLLNARAGRIEEALRHVERLRIFHRRDYQELSKLILKSVEGLGPSVEPLRARLRNL